MNADEKGQNVDDDDKVVAHEEHEDLVRSVLRIDSQISRKHKNVRSEGRAKMSEFDLAGNSGSRKLSAYDLLESLNDSSSFGNLKKQINAAKQRSNTLEAPLHRQAAEEAERRAAYSKTCKNLDKWDGVVHRNRLAPQLVFPLDQKPFRLRTAEERAKQFTPMTNLELEMNKILESSKNNLPDNAELTEAEKEILKAMSVDEAQRRRAKIQKMRALISYQEAKMKRQGRIKSKGYHRIQKKQRRKQMMKELDELRQKDPQAAAEKIMLLEKDRIKERMTLKHKNTGKWAKQMKIFANRNPEAKEAIQEQLRLGQELREKQQTQNSDSDDNSSGEEQIFDDALGTARRGSAPGDGGSVEEPMEYASNPWLQSKLTELKTTRRDSEQTRVVSIKEFDQRAALDEDATCSSLTQPMELSSLKPSSKPDNDVVSNFDIEKLFPEKTSEDDDGIVKARRDVTNSGRRKRKRRRNKQKELSSQTGTNDAMEIDGSQQQVEAQSSSIIDPNNFILAKSKTLVVAPTDVVEFLDEANVNEKINLSDQAALVAEAFADDDVIEDFKDEKRAIEERDKPKDIDLSLPGWGEWAGADIAPNPSKKKKFIIRAPPSLPRKDKFMPGVILSEAESTAIRNHQVSEVPFPYTSVDAFEESVSHPIGKEWNAQTAHLALTEPPVVTKMGVEIAPLDKKSIFKKKRSNLNFGDEGSSSESD